MGLLKFLQPYKSSQAIEQTPVAGVEPSTPAALRHITSVNNTSAGPILEEVDATYPLNFDLYIPTNVLYLQKAQLRIKPRAIRSTVTSVASGGGSTSGSEATHTHTVTISDHTHGLSGVTTNSGGGSTSGSGASHSHSLSGATTDSGGGATSGSTAHTHLILIGSNAGAWADPSYQHSLTFSGGGTVIAGKANATDLGNISSSSDSPAHSHTTPNHTHSFTAQTTASEATHNHSTPNHTHDFTAQTTGSGGSSTPTSSSGASHTHTTPNHTHDQTYGIYEGTSAAGITITINGTSRTAALGGPWNAAALLDITTYLKDANGDVVTGVHTISLGTTQLGRIEVWQDYTTIIEEAWA